MGPFFYTNCFSIGGVFPPPASASVNSTIWQFLSILGSALHLRMALQNELADALCFYLPVLIMTTQTTWRLVIQIVLIFMLHFSYNFFLRSFRFLVSYVYLMIEGEKWQWLFIVEYWSHDFIKRIDNSSLPKIRTISNPSDEAIMKMGGLFQTFPASRFYLNAKNFSFDQLCKVKEIGKPLNFIFLEKGKATQ